MLWNRIDKLSLKKKLCSNPRRLPWCLLLFVFVFGGCSMVGPDYVKPTVPEAEKWLESGDPEIKNTQADFSRWWTVFKDPVLNRLVNAAYQQNLPLQIAGVRILEARARLGVAVGFQYPQKQQVGGDATVNQISDRAPNVKIADKYYYNYQAGFDAGWELDFWGKFRRAVQSEAASLELSIANYDDILVALTAEVARTYVFMRATEERLEVARANVKIQGRSLQIAEVRFKAGAVTELDVTQARSLLRSTEATIPLLESDLRQSKNALAILLGKLPGEIDNMLGGAGLIPEIPAKVAVGIPAELLRRRPDIRAAERALAAQSSLIGVAKADLFPQFALFGSIGLQATNKTSGFGNNKSTFTDLFDSDSLTYFVGPAINWKILNYGRITNRVRVEDARFQELIANYENTVLQASQEVEDSMISFLRSKTAVSFLADAVKASKRSVDLSLIQYREGLVDYQRVLDTQRFLVQQQDDLVVTAGTVAVSLVGLYKALGGGWEIRGGQDFVPADIKKQMAERTNWGDLLSPQQVQKVTADPPPIFSWPDW
jgi:NodT family efflux transporter outer membrane factor (OMF) lipoprotein